MPRVASTYCFHFALFLKVLIYFAALVAEIKELKENKLAEDNVLFAIAAGHQQPVIPHQEYGYSDLSIHEDLYKLVQYSYSCEEMCSAKERVNKAMKLWTTFFNKLKKS
ncbi:hypothetical protein Pint_19374 [Pistacia integerrima]|uniref:Uncharacterized protein n=1 Tax=Pistacia integerrima TaxID=434235 RepID=A0ACC0YXG9_9ROSI|nr:hypothetical protein Pint_19374 [Pistacia integerrima]